MKISCELKLLFTFSFLFDLHELFVSYKAEMTQNGTENEIHF